MIKVRLYFKNLERIQVYGLVSIHLTEHIVLIGRDGATLKTSEAMEKMISSCLNSMKGKIPYHFNEGRLFEHPRKIKG